MNPPLPCDVLPCPGGDVILIPRGQLAIRLDPETRRQLIAELAAFDARTCTPPVPTPLA